MRTVIVPNLLQTTPIEPMLDARVGNCPLHLLLRRKKVRSVQQTLYFRKMAIIVASCSPARSCSFDRSLLTILLPTIGCRLGGLARKGLVTCSSTRFPAKSAQHRA